MPDVDTEDDTKLDQPEGEVNDDEEPESSGVVADVPTLQAKKKETKGKKGGRSLVKGTKRQLDNESEDDAEIGNMIKQLSIQNRIEGFLTKDQQSSAAAWGTWMRTLAQQIASTPCYVSSGDGYDVGLHRAVCKVAYSCDRSRDIHPYPCAKPPSASSAAPRCWKRCSTAYCFLPDAGPPKCPLSVSESSI